MRYEAVLRRLFEKFLEAGLAREDLGNGAVSFPRARAVDLAVGPP
jgi:hypothetical protein